MKKINFTNKVKIKVFDQYSPIFKGEFSNAKEMDSFVKNLKKKMR